VPLDWYVPLPHAVQYTELVAPVMLVYWPTPQAVHDASPGVSAYCPAAHALHAVAPEATSEYEPTTHAVQTDAPTVRSLYAPVAHDVHTNDDSAEASSPYVPAPQPVHAIVPELSAL